MFNLVRVNDKINFPESTTWSWTKTNTFCIFQLFETFYLSLNITFILKRMILHIMLLLDWFVKSRLLYSVCTSFLLLQNPLFFQFYFSILIFQHDGWLHMWSQFCLSLRSTRDPVPPLEMRLLIKENDCSKANFFGEDTVA